MRKKLILLIALVLPLLLMSNSANAGLFDTQGSITFLKDMVDNIDTTTIFAALTAVFTIIGSIKVFSSSAGAILAALGRRF